jgi:hypothetical protein
MAFPQEQVNQRLKNGSLRGRHKPDRSLCPLDLDGLPLPIRIPPYQWKVACA